jgi:hypothetical protein
MYCEYIYNVMDLCFPSFPFISLLSLWFFYLALEYHCPTSLLCTTMPGAFVSIEIFRILFFWSTRHERLWIPKKIKSYKLNKIVSTTSCKHMPMVFRTIIALIVEILCSLFTLSGYRNIEMQMKDITFPQ